MSASRGNALILVENLSVPFDRRVWQEARSLTAAGYGVTVICPRGSGRDTEAHVVLDGVDIHRYPLRAAEGGALSYASEYASALSRTASLIRKVRATTTFDLVHACNPPDALILTGWTLRRRGAARRLRSSRPGTGALRIALRPAGCPASRDAARGAARLQARRRRPQHERVVPRVALGRGRKHRRTCSSCAARLTPTDSAGCRADESLRRGRAHLLAYLGVMGPQDGVDHALRALAELRRARNDWHAIFIGAGDVLDEMEALARRAGSDRGRRVHRAHSGRGRHSHPVHRGRLSVAGPEKPLERRVDHEQGHRVHGALETDRLVRPHGGPRVRR